MGNILGINYVCMWECKLLSFEWCPLSPSLYRSFANVLLGDTDSFQVNHVYKDGNTYTLVSAASEVLGE